jgi:hypothetical protein
MPEAVSTTQDANRWAVWTDPPSLDEKARRTHERLCKTRYLADPSGE